MIRASLVFRCCALSGYFGIYVLILIWYTWWFPLQQVPTALILTVLLAPLLFPLRGLLAGKCYTYSWSSFLALFYFVIGAGDAYSSILDKRYGMLLIIASLLWYIGSIGYVRYSKKIPVIHS